MSLNDEHKDLLTSQGWQEHIPNKCGLWSKEYGDRIHYVDCRGHHRAYSFNSEGQSSPSEKGNKMLSMLKATGEGQKGLGDF